jgi:tetratricopeptide (TPR) repeat protein
MGRKEEAMAEMKRAHALDPVGHLTNAAFGWFLFLSHQYDQAIEQERKTLELFPDSETAVDWLADFYEQKGLLPEALAEYQRVERFSPDSAKWAATLRQGYLKAGAKGYWESKLQLLQAQSKQGYVPPYNFAVIYASLGDRDRALEWLEKEYDEGHDGVVYLKVDPHFDGLRSDPRFQDLVRRMNFPP